MKTIPSHHLTIGFTGINGLHEVYILSKCLKHLCRLYRLFFHSNIALKTFLQNHPLTVPFDKFPTKIFNTIILNHMKILTKIYKVINIAK